MRALLCDDDASVRLIAKRVLEDQFGCTVVECQDGVEALNALSRPLETELHAALDAAAADDAVRAIILTGAGRGFCAGL